MAKFNFGQAADYSTLFAGLYNRQQAQAQAQSVADQNAMDSDMYSQWQQGMISDQDWLNYIAGRVQDTASDTTASGVKLHEHWVTMQREYTNSIADNQAKAAYQAGGSINDYIAYLQNRLGGLNPQNQEYRAIANELMTAQDTRAQNDLSTGAQAIIDDIQAGKKSYQDLLKFYQQGLGEVRSGNTTLYKDVQSKIEQVENQIKSDKIASAFGQLQYQYDAGKLTGNQVAAQLRSLANTYYKNDPTKYYQTLDQAIKMDKVGNAYIGAKKGSGRGRSKLSDGARTQIDVQRANLSYLESVAKQIKKGEPTITTPDGRQFANTPALRQEVFKDYYKASDALAGVYKANGRLATAANVAKSKNNFILTYVQPSNDLGAADHVKAMVVGAMTQMEAALANPDPTQALDLAKKLGEQFQAYAQKLVQTPTSFMQFGEMTGGHPVALQNQPTPKADAEIAAFGQLLLGLSNPSTTRQDALDFIQKAAIGKLIPSTIVHELLDKLAGPETQPANSLEGAGPKTAALLGINSGGVPQASLVATPDGVKVVPMTQGIQRDPTTGHMVIAGRPDLSGILEKGQKTTQVLIDVNGKPMPVTAILAPYKSSDFLQWTNTSGRQITLSDGTKIDSGVAIPTSKMGDKVVQDAINAYGITRQPAQLGLWATMIPGYTDSTGATYRPEAYIYDPTTRTFYQNLPYSFVKMNGDGTVAVDDKGKPTLDYQSFATAGGVPIPYSGSHNQTVQQNWNAHMYDSLVPQPNTRGPGGQVTPNAHDYSTAYFDPSMDSVPDAVSNSQKAAQEYDNYVTAPAKVKVDKAKKAWSEAALKLGSDSHIPLGPSIDGGVSQVSQIAASAGLKVGNFGPQPLPSVPAPKPTTLPQLGGYSTPLPSPTFNTPTQLPTTALPTVSITPSGVPQFQGDMPGESSPAQSKPLAPTVKLAGGIVPSPNDTHAPGHGALEY